MGAVNNSFHRHVECAANPPKELPPAGYKRAEPQWAQNAQLGFRGCKCNVANESEKKTRTNTHTNSQKSNRSVCSFAPCAQLKPSLAHACTITTRVRRQWSALTTFAQFVAIYTCHLWQLLMCNTPYTEQLLLFVFYLFSLIFRQPPRWGGGFGVECAFRNGKIT